MFGAATDRDGDASGTACAPRAAATIALFFLLPLILPVLLARTTRYSLQEESGPFSSASPGVNSIPTVHPRRRRREGS